jgi:Lanthionine-containing peptide SapB precursor RamS
MEFVLNLQALESRLHDERSTPPDGLAAPSDLSLLADCTPSSLSLLLCE